MAQFIAKRILTTLAVLFMLMACQVQAAKLGPSPEIIASYDRSFIERSGAQTFGEMLDTGILRYFFTGGRNLLVMLNGRPYGTTGGNLDFLPLSAIERIEVFRAESLGTIAGHAAVRGAFNLVLRKDLDGAELRAVHRNPSRDGGNAQMGSAFWGGALGKDGHITIGVDVFGRQEISGSTREHSRSEWTNGGSFADSKNVSTGGNTVYIFDKSAAKWRSIALGECAPEKGYTGPLKTPPGITSGDKGCGFAYGNIWWDTPKHDQDNLMVNLDHPLGESAEFLMNANISNGRSAFRYAPSVALFRINNPNSALLAKINQKAGASDPAFTAAGEDTFVIGHRFIGHGNRDWRSKYDTYDVTAGIHGRIREEMGYDVSIRISDFDGLISGDTFVDRTIIQQEIAAGRYDLADPLSTNSNHLKAIKKSSLTESEESASKTMNARLALKGAWLALGERKIDWTTGIEFSNLKSHLLLNFHANNGTTRNVNQVIGSGGVSFAGERDVAGAFAEVSIPLAEKVELRAAVRADEYDDVGGVKAGRFGVVYRPTDIVAVRGSLSSGDSAPSMRYLYSTVYQDHPYVVCRPNIDQAPPRTCNTPNPVQVERRITGNPDLQESDSERLSFGAEARKGPYYFVADWYRLKTNDLPGLHPASWAVLNYPECPPSGGTGCVQEVPTTIHDSFANIVDTEITGLNTRFGARKDTRWGVLAMRGFWRYVQDSKRRVKSVEEKLPLPRNAVRIVSSIGRGNFTAFWGFNYRDEIPNSSGGGKFSSWTGHDLTFDWKKLFGIENARLTAGIYNLTDTKLSTNTALASATDGPRAAGWGRTYFLTFNMRF